MARKTSLFVLSGFLVLSSLAHAETYNFFFDEAKNKRKSQHPVSSSPEEGVPAGAKPPVVIHNNVTVPETSSPASGSPRASASVSAVVAPAAASRPPRWKVAFGPMISRVPYSGGSQFYSRPDDRWDRPAMVLSLGYRFMPAFGVNSFLGLHLNYDWNPVFGADLEAFPIRVDVGRFDLIEVGVLAGVSNILAAASTGGIVPHIGARLNINLGSHVTLTSAMRLAEKFHSTEWSLAFNI